MGSNDEDFCMVADGGADDVGSDFVDVTEPLPNEVAARHETAEAAWHEVQPHQEHTDVIHDTIVTTTATTPTRKRSGSNRSTTSSNGAGCAMPNEVSPVSSSDGETFTSRELENENVVCFGWIKHSGTKEWRDQVNDVSQNKAGYPTWNDGIADEVQKYLHEEKGITGFYVKVKEPKNGGKKRKQDIRWLVADKAEILHKTKQRFLDERKPAGSKRVPDDKFVPPDNGELQDVVVCETYCPSEKSVCLEWNHHAGTREWHKILKICSLSGLYKEWDDEIPGFVKKRLDQHGYGPILVFKNSKFELCLSIREGFWVPATDEEIAKITKEQFIRNRAKPKDASNDGLKQQQGSTGPPSGGGGAPQAGSPHNGPNRDSPSSTGPSNPDAGCSEQNNDGSMSNGHHQGCQQHHMAAADSSPGVMSREEVSESEESSESDDEDDKEEMDDSCKESDDVDESSSSLLSSQSDSDDDSDGNGDDTEFVPTPAPMADENPRQEIMISSYDETIPLDQDERSMSNMMNQFPALCVSPVPGQSSERKMSTVSPTSPSKTYGTNSTELSTLCDEEDNREEMDGNSNDGGDGIDIVASPDSSMAGA